MRARKKTAWGFESLRAEPNGFLVHHLNHSLTLSLPSMECRNARSAACASHLRRFLLPRGRRCLQRLRGFSEGALICGQAKNISYGVRTHAQLPAVDLESTPINHSGKLTTQAARDAYACIAFLFSAMQVLHHLDMKMLRRIHSGAIEVAVWPKCDAWSDWRTKFHHRDSNPGRLGGSRVS